ncbi:ABC transporter permease [Effusibacillus lacus]|uniref:Multidrug ABC transporter substrate-binding protein n=1 Tax=Effusibacillus lacus TaxID=1348429 RepID=A0A292YR02_9BACL|nr:ABC transporter permease [Effusibacillus lacus]TCS74946.1 putative ABC transport system permease protein [Effusibacillus lacus]GAX91616.1 multidrug ABC transporter substrate-binding protein [Effusibacillus lacus]
MKLWESMRVALRSIKANTLRAILTMLGIIIGVSAVIVMVAIGEGASTSVASQINSLGSNLLIVSPGQARQGGVSLGAGSLNTLTLEDAQAISTRESIARVAPSLSRQAQIVWGNQNYSTSVEGTNDAYPEVRNINITQGRFFNRFEVEGQANVAVVGPQVVSNLFGSRISNPVGQTIQINQLPFTIIGILPSQGSSGPNNNDDKIMIPVTTAMNRLFGQTRVRTIYVSAKSAAVMNQAQFEIQQTLRSQHRLSPRDQDDFQISSQAQILSTAQGVTDVMTTLLTGIAAISLVVGGIGIMNIMLVSVTERTREIGIRKALGATRGAILQQFLIESVVLSLLGGIIGIFLGIGGTKLISQLSSITTTISLTPILYAFLSSMFVGIVFGVYPARKAARLKPIDALRYE